MPPYGSSTGRRANKNVKKAAGMVTFILAGVASFLFADAASACRSACIADDGSIVATLNRVDPVVVPTDIDLEKHDCFEGTDPREPDAVLTVGSALR
jgi:hypothetical protein